MTTAQSPVLLVLGAAFLVLAVALIFIFAIALGLIDLACRTTRELIIYCARVCARALDLGRGLAVYRDRTLDLVLDLGRGLAVYRDRTLDLVHDGIRKRSTAVRVLPVAGRLVTAAARLLPTQERARYAEEFGSELWEIAQVGAGRRAQLAYAARQVLAVTRLRARLRAPRRRGAVP
jgi:hypothetical protein